MTDSNLEQTISDTGYAKVLIKLQPGAVGGGAGLATSAEGFERFLHETLLEPDQEQTTHLRHAFSAKMTGGADLALAVARPPTVKIYPRLGLAIGYADHNALTALEANPQVAAVQKAPELSLIRPVTALNGRKRLSKTWGITKLKADKLWQAGYEGQGVIIGHLDTGVDGSHPALTDAIAAFAEFDFQGNLVPGATATDSDEHGTHTAGTLVGHETAVSGPIGVAPKAKLASAMVIEGGDVISRILAGLEWLVDQNTRILSMSLGLRGYTPAFQTVIDALRANNILPVIAVGNEYANTSRSPGNYPNVLSIGAMAPDDTVADFSGSQTFNRPIDPIVPDLVGPGVGIYSSVPGGKFKIMDGTSMATPHIAGLAALLLSAVPEASANDLEAAIQDACTLPATMTQARANRGYPDGLVALAALRSRMGLPQTPTVPRKVARPRRKA
ncbi:S8 family peptidase [Asticcacaulis benevestitus]|uniref:Peptidase S8/S53 domain-containing protein n=1 Tax=Asticcacaulis benevestitus DSM 16100 = ATCC BAA-896 TaxID=1121022 RepID=V4P6Q3_9CAUL|nr:S8 family serine peptidase [Asticcacaulis benevestitus]ESQ83761.1 hypothetical protein ABENE_20020 [Asticcacaulis benevestitus DSM 16100 = ATCC BAA-896]